MMAWSNTIPGYAHTAGPWFVSGVRFRMNGGEWHNISRYDAAGKRDEHIACVGFDPRTGVGLADAHLISAAPDMLHALKMAREGFVAAGSMPLLDADTVALIDEAIAKAEGR